MAHTLKVFANTMEEVALARDTLEKQFPKAMVSYDLAPEPVDFSESPPEFHEFKFGIEFMLDIPGGKTAREEARRTLAHMCGALKWETKIGIGFGNDQRISRELDHANFSLYLYPLQHTLTLYAGTAREVALVSDMLRLKFPHDMLSYNGEPERVRDYVEIDHEKYKHTLTLEFSQNGKEACTNAHQKSIEMYRYLRANINVPGRKFSMEEYERGDMDRKHLCAHNLFIEIPHLIAH